MLIAKPLTTGTVVALKQLSGNDIVGRLAEDYAGGDHVAIRKPIEAIPMQSQGGLALAFAPFSLCATDDQVFRIPRSALMVDPFVARKEITDSYNEQTSSLKLPKA